MRVSLEDAEDILDTNTWTLVMASCPLGSAVKIKDESAIAASKTIIHEERRAVTLLTRA